MHTSDVLKSSPKPRQRRTKQRNKGSHKAFEELINKGDLSSLGTDARGRDLITTKEILEAERGIVDDIKRRKGQCKPQQTRKL